MQVLTTTGWQLVAGGLLLVPVAALAESAPVTVDAGAVVGWTYLSLIGAALAYALWFRGLRSLPPTQVTFLGLLSPLVATLLGWVVLGEALTALQVVGAALLLVSVAAGQGGASAGASGARRTAGDRARPAPAPGAVLAAER